MKTNTLILMAAALGLTLSAAGQAPAPAPSSAKQARTEQQPSTPARAPLLNSSQPRTTMTPITEDTRVFPINPDITALSVSFPTRFGTTLVGHLYLPKDFDAAKRYPAIAVCGPFGAVKEQASGLYAQQLASLGFVAVAFDPSFTGESSGEPRYVASPDINTEDFCAAVDFLSLCPFVEADHIGILGICGWGGLAINAAALDPRIKATVASTMYDMCRVSALGYNDSMTAEDRAQLRRSLADQRLRDAAAGSYRRAGGVIDPLPDDAPQFVKDYYAYYKTTRGYHKRSLNSNEGWNATSVQPFLNSTLMNYAGEITTPVLIVHGEKAHSRYFGEGAFSKLKGDNKKLLIVPGASHVDLYDNMEKIPFEAIGDFFRTNLR